MEKGLVSIITPCYNGERFIAETIDSVLNQTYSKWEMIIINDGSTDGSAELVKKYVEKDSRILLIEQENAGSAVARNHGIRICNGQYIALLDSDDLWDAEFLEKQIRYMQEKNAVCVSCSYRRIDENSKEILYPLTVKPVITYKDMTSMNRIGCLSGLYDSSKYGKIYLREELKSIRDDYAYWLDIVKLEGMAVGNKEVLASYRVLKNSTTGKKAKLIGKQYAFYRNYLNQNPVMSMVNVFRWGVAGLLKFYKL